MAKKSGERQEIYKQFLQKLTRTRYWKQLPDLHEAFAKLIVCNVLIAARIIRRGSDTGR